jgi:RNA polymerase sigma-70 factor (ECF subfamily)
LHDSAPTERPRLESGEIVVMIPALRAFARTFCRSKSDADDLVQETLTKAIANLHRFEPGTRLKSWLFTIMRNTFLTRLTRERREGPSDVDCASSRLANEAPQEWTARVREVRDAIARLPQSQREVLVLIGMLGVSYEETASICGCPVGTVKSRLSRARAALLVELGEAPAPADAGARQRAPEPVFDGGS